MTSITKPTLFADYIAEQVDILIADYGVTVEVRPGRQEIPFPYVLDAGTEFGDVRAIDLARWFPATELAHIGDEIADGLLMGDPDLPHPLSLFDGLRTDFSLARLRHYTGTPPEHVQRYVLFTNYHRYVDEFVDWAGKQLGTNGYTALSGAGGLYLDQQTENARERLSDTAWRRHQMPAYHLMRDDKMGITLVNIGVGPSNAKTICDHLAVLRPEAWLMIGHCGGLRDTQRIGDYVLAGGESATLVMVEAVVVPDVLDAPPVDPLPPSSPPHPANPTTINATNPKLHTTLNFIVHPPVCRISVRRSECQEPRPLVCQPTRSHTRVLIFARLFTDSRDCRDDVTQTADDDS